jgi:hypothetical protein
VLFIADFYWKHVAPLRKDAYKSKDVEQIIRALGSNRSDFCYVHLGISVYNQLMADASSGLRHGRKIAQTAESLAGIACQAVLLLNWKWGLQNYEAKKELMNKFLVDFIATRRSLQLIQNKRKQYGRYDQRVENFYAGIVSACCAEDCPVAYSDAVVAILNISKELENDKSAFRIFFILHNVLCVYAFVPLLTPYF